MEPQNRPAKIAPPAVSKSHWWLTGFPQARSTLLITMQQIPNMAPLRAQSHRFARASSADVSATFLLRGFAQTFSADVSAAFLRGFALRFGFTITASVINHDPFRPTANSARHLFQVGACNFDCCLKRLDRLGLVISSQTFGADAAPDAEMIYLIAASSAALPLFATGLGALGLLGWRRKRKQTA